MAHFHADFTENQLADIAVRILQDHPRERIFAFYGEMGVGKTTLIKEICRQLKVKDIVGSPTFSIVNQYLTHNNQTIYHFDFYRMTSIEEVYDVGYEDYFYSGSYCFLEWPEKVEALLPGSCVKIYLTENNELRSISYHSN